MQAVILAAGESSRFWPLNQQHKSLFCLLGKPLIVHLLENLDAAGIKEVIIVQAPKKDIQKNLSYYNIPRGLKTKFIIQKLPLGTADALKGALKYLQDRFLVFYGDDFYSIEDIKQSLSKFPSLLAKRVDNPINFGVMVVERGVVRNIIEKPQNPISNLVNAGGYFIPKSVLQRKIEKSARGEYEITDYIKFLVRKTKVYVSEAKNWFPLSYVWDLFRINEFLLTNTIKRKLLGRIEKGCYLKGVIKIEKGSVVKSGTYIEGPVFIGKNCQIGPNCYIRGPSSISDTCRIGQGVEIKGSIISKNSKISHMSCILDSVIGENCLIGSGVIFSNLRFDESNIKVAINGKMIDTGRKKLGAILGNRVKIGVNSSLMPGTLVGPDLIIKPQTAVKHTLKI